MYAQVYDPDDIAWQQALQMGREMLPDHPLFMDLPTPAAESSFGAWEPAGSTEVASDLMSESKADASTGASANPGFDDEPEFRIDLSEPELVVPDVASAELTEPLEFDLDPAPPRAVSEALPEPLNSPVDLGSPLSADAIEAAATKLELARAYLDMGDVEGARGMLEEVAQEGTDEQRKDARRLLDEIR